MSTKARKRIIAFALILMLGQLSLVVHATVHNAELSCQICLSQAHSTKAIAPAKTIIPGIQDQNAELIHLAVLPTQTQKSKPYQQRAPPVTPDK